jgi:hypothetical protein
VDAPRRLSLDEKRKRRETDTSSLGVKVEAVRFAFLIFSRAPTRRYSQLGWLAGDPPFPLLGSTVSGKRRICRLCQLSHT